MTITRIQWLLTLALVFAFLGGSTALAQNDDLEYDDELDYDEAFVEEEDVEAQPAEKPVVVPEDKELAGLWEDLLYYIRVARPLLARAYAEAILEGDNEPRGLYRLSAATKNAQDVLIRGKNLEGLKEVIEKIEQMIEEGYLAELADPKEIDRAIGMLCKGSRAYMLAADRLEASGEYAMVQLVQTVLDPDSLGEEYLDPNRRPQLRERIATLLPKMGLHAVRPLSAALQATDATSVGIFAEALGRIGYPHAAPRLKELIEREGVSEDLRIVATQAMIACGGKEALESSASELFYDLAVKYYYQDESLQPDRRYERANVWYWNGAMLNYKPVSREIFCSIYAMRMARLALKHDPQNSRAVSMWLSANFRRKDQLPAGTTDPTRAKNEPTPAYYALAAGAMYNQQVLARAIVDADSAVALGAINALASTQGSVRLTQPLGDGSVPLVRALTYPDRRVRFLAALALANALPTETFEGKGLVISVLGEALRQRGVSRVLVIAGDEQVANRIKGVARGAGWDVIDAVDYGEAVTVAARASGLDMVIVATTTPPPADLIVPIRRDANMANASIVAFGPKTSALVELAGKDARLVLGETAEDEQSISEAFTAGAKIVAGQTLGAEEAEDWALRAASALRRLAQTDTGVYELARSLSSLSAALEDDRDSLRTAAAAALAEIQLPEAQQAIMKLVFNTDVAEAVRISALNSATVSVRRFGNALEDADAAGVLEIVTDSDSDALRNAAAQLLGAMNLQSEQIKSLIVESPGDK